MADEAVKVVAVVRSTEFHPHGRAEVVELAVRSRGKGAHRAADPEKDALKRRFKDAVTTMRRLAAEKDSGADLAAALSKLQAKTFAEQLARLAGMAGGKSRTVTAADLDRLEQTMAWLDKFIPDVETQRLILDWARGESWDAMVHVYGASKPTLWRRIDRAMGDILWGLRVETTNCLKR